MISGMLDEMVSRPDGGSYADQIAFVEDRPGHDFRYAIAADKLIGATGWRALETLESGLRKTVQWYLDHRDWITPNGEGGDRLGLARTGRQGKP